MNKYLVSVDIEGITGVAQGSFAKPEGRHYQLGCRYMVSDVNAVVQGIINADINAQVLVRDAHGDALNLNLEQLHPKAQLLQGWGPQQNMVAGLDHSFKGVFLVGYHAGGHNNRAVLSHTLHSLVRYIKINEKLVNETGIVALSAGHYGVPIAFISGDDHAVREAEEQLTGFVGVVVKRSIARDCISSVTLEEARALLEQGATDAVLKLRHQEISPFTPATPLTLEVGFYNSGFRVSVWQNLAEILEFDPTYRFDHTNLVVSFSAPDVKEILQRLNMLNFLVYGIKSCC